jgi:hypothetical protein
MEDFNHFVFSCEASRRLGETSQWTIGAAKMLVELYEARHQPEEAAKWITHISAAP